MSSFADHFKTQRVSGLHEFVDCEEFREEFPSLFQLFVGTPKQGEDPGLPSCTLMLFVEGGRVKFCINPQNGPRIAFGTITDPVKGFLAIERELSEGHFEWKPRKGRN